MPRAPSYVARMLLAFIAVDLSFKPLVGMTFIHVMARGSDLLPVMVRGVAPVWLVSLALVWMSVRPLDRRTTADEVRRAAVLCDVLPRRITTIWTVQWVGGFALAIVLAGDGFDLVNLCFLATLIAGPMPISHALTAWILAPCRRELEHAARVHGIAIPKRPTTIQRQLLMYAICIATAPGTFMASVGLAAHVHTTPFDTLAVAVGVGFAAVALFAIMNAVLVASVLTRPVVQMTETLRGVAERGGVKREAGVERVPQYQRDEIGVLVEVTNQMLARLEQTEEAREAAHTELAQLTRTLEQRVAERTAELVSAHARLEREQSQRRMAEHELDVARKIQTSILPQRWDVQGLDIGAAMVTATEVGGDYYDILPRPDGGWIGIGDVSGHGVSAGLIMLMVQSITATLVDAAPHASARELVIALDRVLFRNVRHRLRVKDFVTFTLLRYDDDGRVQFAGAHEELIVWRARTGVCERFATPGPWLATSGNIAAHVVESELRLERDDLLVLYTDGITEARDARRTLYGIDRLCRAIEERARDPVDSITAGVIESVRQWCAAQEDDMSIVVARQR